MRIKSEGEVPARETAFIWVDENVFSGSFSVSFTSYKEPFVKNKCYVGNLPYTTTEEELEEMFGVYGDVAKVTIVYDRETDESKGFAFVELANEEQAQAAITGLNKITVNGREIVVNEAREREAKPRDNKAPRKNYDNRR